MTFVDESLLGTGTIRSAKSAGKQQEASAANQRSAFENAFADAGKKKQPTISIGGKTAADGGTQATFTALQNPKTADAATDTVSNGDAAVTDQDSSLSLPSAGGDSETMPAFGATSAALRAAAQQRLMQQAGEEATVEQEAYRQQPNLMPSDGKGSVRASIDLANLGTDATADGGRILDEQAGEKLNVLMKDPKAQLLKHSDSRAMTSDEALPSNSFDTADAPTDTAPADVSHLLALLGATQAPTDVGETTQADTTPVLSEFQALAENAGKAKIASKDTGEAKAPVRFEADASAVRSATEAGSDQIFRFTRADGKGQAVSMNVASDEDKADAGAATTTAKVETVTVVEARRYLGLAPASNASTITNQIASNPEWVNSLQSSMASAPLTEVSTGKVLNTLKIQMHPIDLGTVTATLRLKDDELQVELKVETGDAFRQLSDDQDAMVKALRAQGFAVDQVSVVFNSSDSSRGGDTHQQAQSQPGQQGRETAGDGPSQDRRQNNESGSELQDSGRWTRNEGTNNASSGAEPGRTGDVYM